MAATATRSRSIQSKFVQQTFQWDASESGRGSCRNEEPASVSSQGKLLFLKKSKPLPMPKARSERLGRCEHAGGMMETVLARYGITPEEFRSAVAELRASREMRSVG